MEFIEWTYSQMMSLCKNYREAIGHAKNHGNKKSFDISKNNAPFVRKYLVNFYINVIRSNTGCPKKVHKFKIIYLCSENRQITKLCLIY